jgi:hypothetical protein
MRRIDVNAKEASQPNARSKVCATCYKIIHVQRGQVSVNDRPDDLDSNYRAVRIHQGDGPTDVTTA